jgi:Zn-dependent M28 family amino/carboxypeptidase
MSSRILIAVFVLSLAMIFYSCDRRPEFDGERAYSDLLKQCSFGPRVAGTDAHAKAREFLYNSLMTTTDLCRIQRFTVYDSIAGQWRDMSNIIASYYPGSDRRIMICAHWDSRPISDEDPDSSKFDLPVPGANDGASGIAVLLEIARLLKDHRPPVGIDIVMFDGEDYGTDDWQGGWLMGSRYFVESLQGYRPRLAILVDMVGDSDLQIYRETFSQQYAGDLNDYIWNIAGEVGVDAFIDSVKHIVNDDHIPLLSGGIKAVDIIDFDYPYWHTQEDIPDKCSAESLAKVGKVIVAAIFDERVKRF